MSVMSAAMTGMRAAAARLEISTENLVNQQFRGALPQRRADAMPPINPHTTPAPKVYRPMRANLYSLASSTGDHHGVGVQYRQITPGYFEVYDPTASYADEEGKTAAPNVDADSQALEQIQASVHYRASLKALRTAQDLQEAALDIIA